MDFQTLNRRELQALCKLNKIPANITNIAMIDALKSLETVVGIEELISSRSEGIDVTSPRVPPTSCRTTTRQKVKNPEVESLHATVSRAGSRGVRRQLTGEVNEVLKTPAYSTRRSTRLTAKKSEGPGVTERGKSEPVKMESFLDEVQELDNPIEEKQDVVVLDQSEESKIENAVHVETITIESGEEKVDCCGEVDNSMVKSVEIIEQLEKMDLEDIKPVPEEKPVVIEEKIELIEALNVPVKEQDDVLVLEEQKHSVPIEADYIDENALSFNIETPSDLSMLKNEVSEDNVTPHIADNSIHFNSESPKQPSDLEGIEENISGNKVDVGKAQEEGLMAVDEIRQERDVDEETDESSEADDFVVEEDDIEYLDEVSDNKENEETMNEKESDVDGEEKGTIKSLNEQSLRQLKKQLKALTIKNNMDVSCVTEN